MRMFLSRMPPDTEEAALLTAASVDAERTVALLRITVALGMIAMLFMAIEGVPDIDEQYLRRQVGLAFMTMGAYLALGTASLWAVQRGHFRPWMVWPVVTLDCLFLLANTGLSLANSDVPGLVVFAMPSVWLVPVILAFAVLRFNPLLMGYAAAVITLGLIALALWTPAEVTEDIGRRMQLTMQTAPNMMRVTMIALSGVVLVAAARHTRALLFQSIREARQKANLTRYLPAKMAGRLAGGGLDTLREGRLVHMTVLFIDMRNFTRWCEGRDPAEVSALITDFRSRVQTAADASSGLIDKFLGDAAMVLFEGPNGAASAVDCATRLLEEMDDLAQSARTAGVDPVTAGIGLHCGDVFAGVVGNTDRLEYSVFGDTVNIAARLEKLTREVDMPVVASAAVLAEAGAEPARNGWTALPPVQLRGRSSGVAIFGRGSFAE